MKGAAKLLESGSVDDDWRAVGKLLGYKEHKLAILNDSAFCNTIPF
jgi:hypothetical protein